MNRKQAMPASPSAVVDRQGFTLMEMVVVVGVIIVLILMAILILNPKSSIDKAYDAHRKKDLENLKIAFESYYSDYSCYPTQEQISYCNSDNLDPYINEIPCDPVTNIPYELIAEPTNCPQNFITYAWLKKDSSCFSVNSPNSILDPIYDCTEYISAFIQSGTPTNSSTSSIPTETPTVGPTSTPVPAPIGEPTPTIPFIPYYYCSGYNNCTSLTPGQTCDPNFPWPDVNCSRACDNPANFCTPQ